MCAASPVAMVTDVGTVSRLPMATGIVARSRWKRPTSSVGQTRPGHCVCVWIVWVCVYICVCTSLCVYTYRATLIKPEILLNLIQLYLTHILQVGQQLTANSIYGHLDFYFYMTSCIQPRKLNSSLESRKSWGNDFQQKSLLHSSTFSLQVVKKYKVIRTHSLWRHTHLSGTYIVD